MTTFKVRMEFRDFYEKTIEVPDEKIDGYLARHPELLPNLPDEGEIDEAGCEGRASIVREMLMDGEVTVNFMPGVDFAGPADDEWWPAANALIEELVEE